MVNAYTVSNSDERRKAMQIIEQQLSIGEKPIAANAVRDLFEKIKSGELSEEEFARKVQILP